MKRFPDYCRFIKTRGACHRRAHGFLHTAAPWARQRHGSHADFAFFHFDISCSHKMFQKGFNLEHNAKMIKFPNYSVQL